MRRFLLAGVAALALTGCTAFEDGPATVPGSALARVAERLAANGDATTAATLYRSAIAMGNGSAEVRRGYGNALLALGQPQAAIEQYEAALTQVKDARLYNGIGVALDMLGDHARAQERFREGLALAPDNKGLIHNYGLSLAAEAEKGPAATAEAAPGEPDESAPAKVALQPVPQDEPTPVLRPAAVPSVIPTLKSKTVAMREALREPLAPREPPPLSKPTAMRDSMPEPVSPELSPAPEPAPATSPVSAATPEVVPAAVTTPALSSVAAPAIGVAPVATAVLASLPAPETSEVPFTRTNEIVPLGRPVATTPLYGGYFRVRLAGYGSRERAVEFRQEIARQAPELRDAMRVVQERPSLALRAPLRYTLVSAPLPSRRAAEAACETLSERGVACLAEPAASPLTLRS